MNIFRVGFNLRETMFSIFYLKKISTEEYFMGFFSFGKILDFFFFYHFTINSRQFYQKQTNTSL